MCGGARPICRGLLGFAGGKVLGNHFWVLCCAAEMAGAPRETGLSTSPGAEREDRQEAGLGPRRAMQRRGRAPQQGSACVDNCARTLPEPPDGHRKNALSPHSNTTCQGNLTRLACIKAGPNPGPNSVLQDLPLGPCSLAAQLATSCAWSLSPGQDTSPPPPRVPGAV